MQTLARVDRQVEFSLPINPLDPLVVPGKAFDVVQREKAQAKSPLSIRLRQADQPIGDGMIVLVTDELITITALAHAEGATRMANACLAPLDRRHSHRAATAESDHFFAMASLSQSALSCASA